ncbi:MAG: dihydroorotate dehydrogenase electron transfer subunit [Bacteroidales bacterium]|nr:dihydroorotate dehydrogenase electron transfer subunit [Bacteroidales bacterium]
MTDMMIAATVRLSSSYGLLRLSPADGSPLLEAEPGQFVQVLVPDSPTTFLRRPISICNIDAERGELWLLVRDAGEGTRHLINLPAGSVLNIIYPLGHGFDIPEGCRRPLLVGGGVGVAPLLYLGRALRQRGVEPTFLVGARSRADLLLLDELAAIGEVVTSTDDGSYGEPGVVTLNSAFQRPDIDYIYCCGPMPMMKAVARRAVEKGVECQVSLENTMACGLGACLCCVEPTVKGNVCVCTEGPVFNIHQLTWQISE